MNQKYPLKEIVKLFDNPEVVGNVDVELSAIASLEKATPTDLTFLGNKKYAHEVPATKAGAVLLPRDYKGALPENSTVVRVDNPSVELAKLWRTDRALRHLEAMMIVADADTTLVLSGNGDVIEPEGGIAAIGSGGNYALSAARALVEHTEMEPQAIVHEALKIAGDLCIYTNQNHIVEVLGK